MTRFIGRLVVLLIFALSAPLTAGDWPAWRHDSKHSNVTTDSLPEKLQLHWVLDLPQLTPAWPDQPLMTFDSAYEPVVVGQTLYLASSRTDSVTAYDTRSANIRWRFHADGPVRFAPYHYASKLYVVSDDGFLYCLKADTGDVVWKIRGGPYDRRILGNNRLVSAWPARGAPVAADGVVYFAASIWPFMGIFIHALDAETGKVIWTNDGDGSIYIKQPHAADSFAGVAPQGPMAIDGDVLLIPGGRSVPAAYDRKTGKLLHYLLNDNSKKGGGHTVTVAGDVYFSGLGTFRTRTGAYLGDCSPVACGNDVEAYSIQAGEARVLDLQHALPHADDPKAKFRPEILGAIKAPSATSMIRAGNRLYIGMLAKVAAVDLPLPAEPPARNYFVWEAAIEGVPLSIVAADDRLFVSTREGRLYCFGEGKSLKRKPQADPKPMPENRSGIDANAVLESTGIRDGYAVVWHADAGLIASLVRSSNLHVIAVDPDSAAVATARQALCDAGLYGERCSVHVGSPDSFPLPQYLASLMVAKDLDSATASRLYELLRPYGGALYVSKESAHRSALERVVRKLPNAVLKETQSATLVLREGALPGAADWTHEHGDSANTRVSKDSIVKAPLGVLWFGGTSNEGILPRHGHGPQPQVVGGRIIIEGADKFRAVDAYTGRLLWETYLPGVGDFYNNLAHQPGANSRGSNYVSLPDGIYIAYKTVCIVLDPATGKVRTEYKLPLTANETAPVVGFVNAVGDYLVVAIDPLIVSIAEKQSRSASKLFKTMDESFAASRRVAVLERKTGKFLWSASASYGFRHNTICAGNGRLFAIDRLSGAAEAKSKENGVEPGQPCVMAWDLTTGKELWRDTAETFGTWLSYSEKYDILVEAGRVARDTLADEPKGMRAYRGADGRELWFDKAATGPAMLHGDTILRGQGACDLQTGKTKMRIDPLTGQPEEWTWTRNYGCNTPMASEHLLTFRSGAAGYFDLCHDSGTGNLGGFRSSCTNNLTVANGILVAPEYTRTCTCSYQNQTSIALVPMADAEEWTSFGKSEPKKPIVRLGINFGAPGDRRADDGTLWLEHPSVGGASPIVPVTVVGENLKYFRRHQSTTDGELSWVASSGVVGVDSVTIKLSPTATKLRRYTVRLYFAEPEDIAAGQRIFDVSIQNRPVLSDFDIVKEARKPRRTVMREFRGVAASGELRLSFRSTAKLGALICGVEAVAE